MKLSTIWSKIGKQPLRVTQHKDATVFVGENEFYITGIKYESGQFLGFNAVSIDCSTCKYLEKEEPHTCDICTSLDNDDDYTMWECGK